MRRSRLDSRVDVVQERPGQTGPYHAKPEVYERAVEALVLGPREGFGRWITP